MRVATARLNMFLKMHAKYPVCAQKIDDVGINIRCICVHMKRYSVAMCIMFCTKSAHAYLVYAYVLFMYMPSQTACQLNTRTRANQNA